jgi:hypothetical protein
MAGGPTGTSLSSAQALYAYSRSGYVTPSGSSTAPCEGLFAYFAAPVDIALAPGTGTTQTCPLQPGWNMVGDPFADPALLPPGVIGYFWDPAEGRYVSEGQIPAGGAVWLYAPAAASITLQAAPQGSLTLAGVPVQSQPVQLHVGEYLTLLVHASSSGPAWVARADATYLQPLGSGALPSGDYYYRWQAKTVGDTVITLDPACLRAGCAQPSLLVRITILA